MFTVSFWKQAAERAAKSAAQALIGAWFLSEPVDAMHLDWKLGFGVAAGGAVLSLLTSVVSAPFGPEKASPSLVEIPPPGDNAVLDPKPEG